MNDRGATTTDYALTIIAIAAAIVLAVSLFGTAVRDLFSAAAQIFQQAP